MNKIFALCSFVPEQKTLITKHCFGDCGKILVGALTIDGYEFAPCDEEKCKYEEKREDFHGVSASGKRVWLRKLKEAG